MEICVRHNDNIELYILGLWVHVSSDTHDVMKNNQEIHEGVIEKKIFDCYIRV